MSTLNYSNRFINIYFFSNLNALIRYFYFRILKVKFHSFERREVYYYEKLEEKKITDKILSLNELNNLIVFTTISEKTKSKIKLRAAGMRIHDILSE